MTAVDVTEFSTLLAKLGRIHGKKSDGFARDYFEALKDIPIEVLREASGSLVQSARYWPKPVDWRTAAQKVEVKRAVPLSEIRASITLPDGRVESTYHCLSCEDTGWRPDCGCRLGDMDMRGHCPTHGAQEANGIAYRRSLRACGCRDGNPMWQFHHRTKRVEAERVRTDG